MGKKTTKQENCSGIEGKDRRLKIVAEESIPESDYRSLISGHWANLCVSYYFYTGSAAEHMQQNIF